MLPVMEERLLGSSCDFCILIGSQIGSLIGDLSSSYSIISTSASSIFMDMNFYYFFLASSPSSNNFLNDFVVIEVPFLNSLTPSFFMSKS